jgi:hypothetical protein
MTSEGKAAMTSEGKAAMTSEEKAAMTGEGSPGHGTPYFVVTLPRLPPRKAAAMFRRPN